MIERKIKIKAPIEVVYQVIRDFESYPDFLTTTDSAKEKKLKSSLQVDFTVQVVKTIHYTLKFRLEEPTLVEWDLVKGDLMKKNTGAWRLTKVSDTLTEAVYQIDIDFGWLVPKMIIEQVTKTQLPETLEAFKTRAETFAREKQA
jgi:ribosome-associated toxin RatA of RatAB toxin-antitoxin module